MKKYHLSVLLISTVFIASCNKYTENARNIRLQGLKDVICKGTTYDPAKDSCGERSYWLEADTGLIAYITIYGIQEKNEAVEISTFITKLRKSNQQEHIPINLKIFSSPRSLGRNPSDNLILNKDI